MYWVVHDGDYRRRISLIYKNIKIENGRECDR